MKPTSLILLSFLVLVALAGLIDPLLENSLYYEHFNLGITLVLVTFIFAWYYYDSEARQYKRSPALNVTVVAMAIIGIPYYLFRSRGAKNGGIAFGHMLLFFCAWLFTTTVSTRIGSMIFNK